MSQGYQGCRFRFFSNEGIECTAYSARLYLITWRLDEQKYFMNLKARGSWEFQVNWSPTWCAIAHRWAAMAKMP